MIAVLNLVLFVASTATSGHRWDAEPFAWQPNDRVVLLGGTFIEREQKYGHVEAALLWKERGKNLSVRNLGWSGDTVFGDARAGFDNAKKGYERLVNLTKELQPTVIVLAYGQNESFAQEAGIEAFRKQYQKLRDDLQRETKARLLLLTPPPFQDSPGAPPSTERNANLARYVAIIHEVAREKNLPVIDTFSILTNLGDAAPRTENGLHYNDQGYRELAKLLAPDLAVPERLTALVRAKNELFFHRWRPQNETYLFGFRKHEQGKNAAEIVQFDPLIAKVEQDLVELLRQQP